MGLDLATLAPVALVLCLGAISPGPSLAVVLRNTIAGGRARGISCSIGHGLGFGIYAFLAINGIALFNSGGGGFATVLELAGAAFLMWVAITMLRKPKGKTNSNGGNDGKNEVGGHPTGNRVGFTEGFLIAFLNPKIFVFLTAIFSQFVAPEMPMTDKLALAGIAFIIDTSWYIIVSIALSGTAILEGLRKQGRMIDIVVALILITLASGILMNHFL